MGYTRYSVPVYPQNGCFNEISEDQDDKPVELGAFPGFSHDFP
jgi:hypothetical protein